MSPSSRRSRRAPSGSPAGLRGARGGGGGGRVRIIGGEWRGRLLDVADVPGLRPSGDRMRETVFNWLQPRLPGARCLDLFAGSGALGLEAVSRGAREVVLVERDPRAADAIERALVALDGGARARLVRGTAEACLVRARPPEAWAPFDIVFVDPPFDTACQRETLSTLADGHLADAALIHVEAPLRQILEDTVPDGFELVRERRFGDAVARLVRFLGQGASPSSG